MFTNLRLAGPSAEPAACEMSKQRLPTRFREGWGARGLGFGGGGGLVDMNLFMGEWEPSAQEGPRCLPLPRLPGEQTFMKTFPSKSQ